MPKYLEGEKEYILDERFKVVQRLIERGYSDAQIGRILFNVHRSTIGKIRKLIDNR